MDVPASPRNPIRRDSKYKLFLRSEVAQRRQQTTGQ